MVELGIARLADSESLLTLAYSWTGPVDQSSEPLNLHAALSIGSRSLGELVEPFKLLALNQREADFEVG